MPSSRWLRIAALLATAALSAMAFGTGQRWSAQDTTAASIGQAPAPGSPAPPNIRIPQFQSGGVNTDAPTRPASPVDLSDGVLRDAVERAAAGLPAPAGVHVAAGRIQVEVVHDLTAQDMRDVIVHAGGVIEGEAAGITLASIPLVRLTGIEHHGGVRYVRPPVRIGAPADTGRGPAVAPAAIAPVAGAEVTKTNAIAWQAAGQNGAGVKIGIVDFFDQTIWNAAQNAGEVPAPAGTFCRDAGSPCNVFTVTPGVQHGTAVAEIVHEMAPDAQIFLAVAGTTTDLQGAVDYFASQGVKIISRSLVDQYDGPGDGTGAIASVVNSAITQGMTWFNAAGNNANDGTGSGGYWRGSWADANNNGWLDFASGDEYLGFVCSYPLGLRWSDWGANRTDYDLYIYSSISPTRVLAHTSVNNQTAGAPPLELSNIPCDGTTVYYAGVKLVNAGAGTAGDVLEFGVNGCCLAHWQDAYSAAIPASDSFSSGAMSVGAIDPASGTTIAKYSSQGPTNDGRIKPNLSAASCVASFTYAPNCFNGTSAATPATAGAAALVLGAGLASTPAQLTAYLLNSATVDRGAAGADNVYGRGELVLPAPPPTTPVPLSVGGIAEAPDAAALPQRAGTNGRGPRAWHAGAGALLATAILGGSLVAWRRRAKAR